MKQRIDDLALFGGSPIFSETKHVGRPNIGDKERLLSYFNNILERKWLTNNGPYVLEFEKQLTQILETEHCIAMCNGTIAMEIAIRALDLTGEVIVPSMTFIATAHSLSWQGITPIFCDMHPENYTIDPIAVEKLITEKTTGIIGVHLWGYPCNIDALEKLAKKYNLKLIFDSCHALGCSYQGKMIGGFGDAEVFSFHATKFVNAFEGGLVSTNNTALADKIRLMRNFGFQGEDNVVYYGTNGKMSEISAAMGLTSLQAMSEFINTNQENYQAYTQKLSQIAGITVALFDEKEKQNYQYIIAFIDESKTKLHRNTLQKVLKAENIYARRYFNPGCHRMPIYAKDKTEVELTLPVTDNMAQKVLSLPTGTGVTLEEITIISDLINFSVQHAEAINARIAAAH